MDLLEAMGRCQYEVVTENGSAAVGLVFVLPHVGVGEGRPDLDLCHPRVVSVLTASPVQNPEGWLQETAAKEAGRGGEEREKDQLTTKLFYFIDFPIVKNGS